jgi:hypothetical protein
VHAQERPPLQVEGPFRLLANELLHLGFLFLSAELREVDMCYGLCPRFHQSLRRTVFGRDENRPQYGVAPLDLRNGAFDSRDIEMPRYA